MRRATATLFIVSLLAVMVTTVSMYFIALTHTYDLCQSAHDEYSNASEQKCGNWQDMTNSEFLCDNTGNNCWLETK